MRRIFLGLCVLLPILPLQASRLQKAGMQRTEGSETPAPPDFETDVLDFLDDYCLRCHEGNLAEAQVDLSLHLTEEDARQAPDLYWKAAWKVWDHAMPPPRRKEQPSLEERARFLAWVDADDGLGVRPEPRWSTLRRMNRNTFRRSVRDLCGITLPDSVWDSLPSDEAGDGFDNIGSSLTLSDDAVLRYLEVAEQVAQEAVQPWDPGLPVRRMQGSELEAPQHQGAAAALYSRGEASMEFQAPREGRYLLRIGAWGNQAGDEPCRVAVLADGKVLKQAEVPTSPGEETEILAEVRLVAGRHRLAASFLNDYWKPDAPEGTPKDRNLYIAWFAVEGPLDPLPPTAFQHDLLAHFPLADADTTRAMQLHPLLTVLMERAWRRPPTTKELRRYAGLVLQEKGWEARVRLALTAVLTSPHFLFETPSRPKRIRPGVEVPLQGDEFATRLAFFLWGSLPDAALLEAARAEGFLQDEAAILAQVERMLADPRAQALAEDFARQCFRIRGLEEHVPDQGLYPSVDADLLRSMAQETERLFLDILHGDRDLRDLLTSDRTFLNARLAAHYGMEWPEDSDGWLAFDLSDSPRRGVLGHASVLTMTSLPTRTSPVRRGRWILDNILGAPPPPPPADAGLLDESPVAAEEASLRERLALHRSDPKCISCHTVMDPLGFSLERFDAVGRWRTEVDGHAVDAGGALPDGTHLESLRDLVEELDRRGGFPRLLVRRLSSYALGRTLGPGDRPFLQGILEDLDPEHPTLRQAIHALVLSEPFRYHATLASSVSR